MHGHAPVGLAVNGGRGVSQSDLWPRGDGRFDLRAVAVVSDRDAVPVVSGAVVPGADAVVMVTGLTRVRGDGGRPGGGGHDVDGAGGRRAAVVVDGRRRGDGRGVIVTEFLSQTVLHVFVRQRRRVTDLVL